MTDLGIGIHPGITRSEYERVDAINVSILAHFERSAAHARDQMLHPKEPTKAMIFGTDFHCSVLEPDRFDREYIVPPKVDRRTKEGKAEWAKFEATYPRHSCSYIDQDDMDAMAAMSGQLWQRPLAASLLRGGLNEVAVIWRDEETGLMCKGLLDHIGTFDGWTWIVDLKSTPDASRWAFTKSIKNLHYGARAAFYFDGCNTVAPRERRFAWIACESEPPYPVAEYEAMPDAIEAGRSKYKRWLRLYKEAIESGIWPAYPQELQQLTAEDTEYKS